MKRAVLVALGTGALIASAAAIGIGMTSASAAEGLTRAAYEGGLAEASLLLAAAGAQCDARRGAEREVCRAEAEAAAAIRTADLRAAFERTQESARNAQRTRVDARYQVQRAQCQPLGGFKRDKCLVAAHAERGRSLLDIAAPYAVRYTR